MLEQLNAISKQLKNRAVRPIGSPFLSDARYHAFGFDKAWFRQLEKECNLLCAVDGGNAELLGNASSSLQFVRVYGNVFEGKKRVLQEKHEFFALTQAADGETFETRLLPLRGGLLQEEGVLQLSGKEVPETEERSKAARVGALTRRFAEWALTEKILEQFNDVLLIKDGTLQTSVRREAFYAQRAFAKVSSSKQLAALSKTSTLLTTTGWSVVDAVESIAPKGSWVYCWVAESEHPDHPARIGVAKLHPYGRAFRIDAYKAHETLPWLTLAKNASDPSFLGYPYALVDADHNARVTEEETSSLKGMVEATLGVRKSEVHEWLSRL